jgi:predicted protein tyrosine phosphatase
MPKITIASYDEAHSLLGLSIDNFAHVVSINDPETPPPETLEGHRARKLVLYFYDVLGSTSRWPEAPTKEDVHAIIRFARGIKVGDPTLVHCAAGISRSSAAALTILATKVAPTRDGATEAHRALLDAKAAIRPNRTMVQYADRLLGFGGTLLAVRDEVFSPATQRQPLDDVWDDLDHA